jgi:hypothetical protein
MPDDKSQKEGKRRVDNGGMDIKEGVLAWKSGLKVPLLPLGPSCPLQTILLSDLVGCDNSLQMVMAVWHTFFNNLKCAKQPLLSAAGCHTRSGR